MTTPPDRRLINVELQSNVGETAYRIRVWAVAPKGEVVKPITAQELVDAVADACMQLNAKSFEATPKNCLDS